MSLTARRRGLMGNMRQDLGNFNVCQGRVQVESRSKTLILDCPGIDQTKTLVYCVAICDGFSDYYSSEYANNALGYLIVNNKNFPVNASSLKYLYTVNSNGTKGDYFSTDTSYTVNDGTVTVTNKSTKSFAPGMTISWVVVWM